MTAPRILSIPQAAVVLGKPETTVRGWVQRGEFPVEIQTIAGNRFVRTADLVAWLGITTDVVEHLLAETRRPNLRAAS